MAKLNPDDRQAAGEAQLAGWGVPRDAGLDVLVALLHRDPAADIAIAHRLGGIANEASARALEALEHAAADRLVRREAKRARYRLQQRGVMVAPAPVAPPPPAVLGAPIEGYISSLDGRGDQLVWLVKPQPGGALHLFAVINDPDGMREVALHAVTRKALKALRAELEQRHEVKLVPIDWRYADHLVRRAFEWARVGAARMDGDYPALRAQFSRQPAPLERPDAVLPPIDSGAGADRSALTASADLLAEPELRTWIRPLEEMKPYLDELAGVQDSPLVLNQMQQQERFEAVILRAVDDIFGGAHRPSWSRRLSDQAVYFAATRRAARAAQALAVGQALAGDTPPRDLPLCQQLVRASLAMFLQLASEREQERQQSSLVLTPQQAARRRER